jgi:hypothetical protein
MWVGVRILQVWIHQRILVRMCIVYMRKQWKRQDLIVVVRIKDLIIVRIVV